MPELRYLKNCVSATRSSLFDSALQQPPAASAELNASSQALRFIQLPFLPRYRDARRKTTEWVVDVRKLLLIR